MSFMQVRIIYFGENEDKKRIGEYIILQTLNLEEHLYYIIDLHCHSKHKWERANSYWMLTVMQFP